MNTLEQNNIDWNTARKGGMTALKMTIAAAAILALTGCQTTKNSTTGNKKVSKQVSKKVSRGSSVKRKVASRARKEGVPVKLALAVAEVESTSQCGRLGGVGERGPMQIRPSTARELGYRGKNSGLNCDTGIKYSMKYLRKAYKKSGGNACHAATFYNRGLGTQRVTSGYCKKVLAAMGITKGRRK